jgi:hypothetical protein
VALSPAPTPTPILRRDSLRITTRRTYYGVLVFLAAHRSRRRPQVCSLRTCLGRTIGWSNGRGQSTTPAWDWLPRQRIRRPVRRRPCFRRRTAPRWRPAPAPGPPAHNLQSLGWDNPDVARPDPGGHHVSTSPGGPTHPPPPHGLVAGPSFPPPGAPGVVGAPGLLGPPPPQHTIQQPVQQQAFSGFGPWDQRALAGAFSTMTLAPPAPSGDWYMDSGATAPMASQYGILSHSYPPSSSTPSSIIVGDGTMLPITATGSTHVGPLHLDNVLVPPT